MQTSIILLLVACIALAIEGYYFGFVRPPRVLAWLQQATFIIMTFMLVPLLLLVLYYQSAAEDRLKEAGFTPHPSIRESIGIGFGAGNNPIWVFEFDAGEQAFRDFYTSAENTGDWKLVSDNGFFLIFEQAGASMLAGFREGRGSNTLTFTLDKK